MHPSGVAKSSTSFVCGKSWNVTSAWWQVTLCDPIWHVSSRLAHSCRLLQSSPQFFRFGFLSLQICIYTIIKTTSVPDGSSVGDGLALHGKQT